MTPLPSGSHPDVVEEHLEEAAFLYGQRRYLARTHQATWDRLSPIEERFEAHVDGLAVAGPEGRDLVRAALDDGLPGAVHLAARLLCRAGDVDAALDLTAALDERDVDDAVDAVAHEASVAWTDRLVVELETDAPRRVRVAADVVAATRAPAGAALLRALARTGDTAGDAPTEGALVRALGALRYPPARSTLTRRALGAASPVLSQAVERARVRFGDRAVLVGLTERALEDPSAALPLALIGGPRHAPPLVAAARSQNPGAPVALGVLGDPAHVPVLLLLLEDGPPQVARSAAIGLRVLTGAPLVREVLVPDDPADPGLGGDLVVRPSQDPAEWRSWWAEHGGALQPGTRYRAGQPFRPTLAVTAAVGGLADDLLPPSLRQALADELAGRYGLDAPFRADAFVSDQRAALAALAEAAGGVRSGEGAWVERSPTR